MLINSRKLILTSVIAAVAVPSIPALAALEEVVVTARKREESILKVPIAATALTGEQLSQFNTHDLYTATERVPGFVMGTQVGSIGPTPSLRGIGTGTLNPTIDQSVALNIDGLGFSQALAFSSGVFDMKQMEVLRGPQSLFFGKNSTAGVISINTQDPGDEFELVLGTAYESEAEEVTGEFIVSGPISDTLGLRLAAKISDMDGYKDNKAIGDGVSGVTPKHSRVPNKEDIFLRGTALWQPSDDLNVKLKLNYTSTEIDGSSGGGETASCPDGLGAPNNPLGAVLQNFYGGVQSPQFLSLNDNCKLDGTIYIVDANPNNPLYTGIRNNGEPFYDFEQYFGSLQINYDISPTLSLASVTGFYDAEHSVMINGGQTAFAGPLIIADTDFEREEFTQEFRLSSNFDGPLNFMAGLYYQDAEMANRTGLFFLGPRDQGYLPIDIETKAVFGQVQWQITPEFELSAGARYTEETREFNPRNLGTGLDFDIATYVTDELDTDNVSPEVALTYTPTDDLTLFISYRKAFKSGSFDTVSNPRGFDLSFGDEEVEGFEGGMKMRLLDNTMAINLSVYSYEYDDLQVGANESTDDGFVIRTLNAASADVRGIDFDITYEPASIEGLQLFAVANFNDAEYNDFDNAQCWGGQTIAEGCNLDFFDPTTPNATGPTEDPEGDGLYQSQDLSGGDLLRAPDLTATFGFTYETPVSDGNMIMSFGTSTQYSDKFATNTLLRDDFYQDSFIKTSASVGLRDRDGAWEVSLVGKNLNDEITAGNCTNFNGAYGNTPGTIVTGGATTGLGGVDELTCITERGRELWLSVTLRPMLF